MVYCIIKLHRFVSLFMSFLWSKIIIDLLFTSLDLYLHAFFFFKQKTAYEMRISDWSSDVCSSDLAAFTVLDRGLTADRERSREFRRAAPRLWARLPHEPCERARASDRKSVV